jgi:hypothetical protein
MKIFRQEPLGLKPRAAGKDGRLPSLRNETYDVLRLRGTLGLQG